MNHRKPNAVVESVQKSNIQTPLSGHPVDYQQVLVQHLELIDRVVHFIARRHRLSASDAEEFTSIVRFKLIEKDFAILRKFQGRSHLSTYLTTVIERQYLDHCIARWGKWRPSAAARRMGAVAIDLERLIAHDGLTFDEAVGTLQTNHGITESREQLHALMLKLPVRPQRKLAGEEGLALAASRPATIDIAVDEGEDALVARIESALSTGVAALSQQNQLILRLVFEENVSVAQIARVFSEEPKQLYRRLERILGGLRKQLEREGIEQPDVDRIMGHPAFGLGRVLEKAGRGLPENGGMGPSIG